MNDQQIEQEIQAKGLTAPRVTPADIEANIAGENSRHFSASSASAQPLPPVGLEHCAFAQPNCPRNLARSLDKRT